MVELWAKKRPVNGMGFPYEFISSFDRSMAYSEMDKLDPSIYQEALITDENGAGVLFKEFEKPYVKSIKPE